MLFLAGAVIGAAAMRAWNDAHLVSARDAAKLLLSEATTEVERLRRFMADNIGKTSG